MRKKPRGRLSRLSIIGGDVAKAYLYIEALTKDAGFDVDHLPIPLVATQNPEDFIDEPEVESDNPTIVGNESGEAIELSPQWQAAFDVEESGMYSGDLVDELDEFGARLSCKNVQNMFEVSTGVKEQIVDYMHPSLEESLTDQTAKSAPQPQVQAKAMPKPKLNIEFKRRRKQFHTMADVLDDLKKQPASFRTVVVR